MLLNEGVSINPKDKLQQTPLLLACRVSSFELTQLLLQNEASQEGYDKFGKNACRYAIENGRFDIVDLFKSPFARTSLSNPGSNVLSKPIDFDNQIELYHQKWLKVKDSKSMKERCQAYALFKQATRGDNETAWQGSIWSD